MKILDLLNDAFLDHDTEHTHINSKLEVKQIQLLSDYGLGYETAPITQKKFNDIMQKINPILPKTEEVLQ